MFTLKNSISKALLMSLAIFAFVVFSNANAQEFKYNDSWGPDGMSVKAKSPSGVTVNFSTSSVILNDVMVNGMTMKSVNIPSVFLPNNEGYPDLAGTGRFIAIPQGSKATYRIISSRIERYSNVEVAPAPRIPLETESGPLQYTKNNSVYSKNAYYPENIVMLSEASKIRGIDVVMLGITPFQYNPVTKELIVYRDLQVQVDFIGGNGKFGEDRLRSRWFDPILSDNILNSDMLPVIDYGKLPVNSVTPDYEYVIIRPNNPEFAAWADTIKNFRNKQGIRTGVYSIADIGGNTPTQIETWINNAYNTWTVPPVAILILGDYGTDGNINVTSPIWNSYCVSDNIYGDVNGDDMPEIIMARMTANNNAQLQVMVTKSLGYELNPPTSASFYNKPITALGWQTERWFQICSEVMGGFFKKKFGMNPTRINVIYSGTPGTVWSTATNTSTVVNYFGTVGLGYIPMTPDSLGNWNNGSAQMVVDALNAGAFMLQHRDHGAETGWGEPAFQSSHISQLTNTNLSYIFSINCLTGKYNYGSECFAEKFHRYTYNGQNAGCVGILAASEVSYSFVNDTYAWGLYDNMWPSFMPAYGTTPSSRDVRPGFGNAAGKYFLQQSSWPYNTNNKQVTYHLFHHHGDAFLQMYYAVPTALTPTHASTITYGATTFNVTVDSGAFICLSYNGNIVGRNTSVGGTTVVNLTNVPTPGNQLDIVITKQNKYRYMQKVNVIPASGPFVVYLNSTINDAPPLGNGNGLMDYAETNKLNLKIKNVGFAQATNVNVKVTTTDSYITMTDSTELYGNINSNDSLLINNAFTYNVANNIPDMRTVQFKVTATSGSNEWISYFDIVAHAPFVKKGSHAIVDSIGNNNGRWDANEQVKLKVFELNTGSSQAKNVTGRIICSSPYVTINLDSNVYGNINGADSVFKYFTLTSAANTPAGTVATVVLRTRADYNVVKLDTMQLTIGQNVAIIGNGTTACGWPFYTFYMDSRTCMLYTSAEILASGVSNGGYITKIGFDVTTAASQVMNGFKVYMKNESASSLSGFMTGGTLVYDAPYTVTGTGWQYINLTTPFLWIGSQNLAIEICFNNSSYTSNTTVKGTPNTLNQNKHNHSDLSSGDGCVSITSPGTTYTARPNISLTVNAPVNLTNENNLIPTKYELAQNFPNPFNPSTKINFAIPKQGMVTLKVFDILGREVAVLVNDVKQPGYYSLDFDASHLASGVYFYKLTSGTFNEVKRMVLVK